MKAKLCVWLRSRSWLPRRCIVRSPSRPLFRRQRDATRHGVCAAKEGAAMATTRDRLEQLTNVERELHDHDVVA